MFIRKLYYDLNTGAVIESHMRHGNVRMTTFAEDAAVLPTLAGRSEEDTGCMVWTELDAAVEAHFDTAICVGVDITQNPPAIIWEYHTNDADLDESV